MTNRPRYPKPDANQKVILRELNQLPRFSAWNNSRSSDRDCPGDILVLEWPTQRWQPFEIKTEDGEVSPGQEDFRHYVPVIRRTEDVLRFFEVCE